eukprot:XP_019922796.1 PREDICTED: uncharacterized protein LOC105328240 [Crassostrea gigas]
MLWHAAHILIAASVTILTEYQGIVSNAYQDILDPTVVNCATILSTAEGVSLVVHVMFHTVTIFKVAEKKVSSPEAMPNVSLRELMNQDTSMLSKQTTLTEEYTQREEELYLSYQEDKSWHISKVLFYFIIGLLFIAVLLVCIHIILCFVD